MSAPDLPPRPPRTRGLDRRQFLKIATGLSCATPFAAVADEPPAPVRRIGFLGNSTAALEANLVGPFRESLHELGYVEGRNLVTVYRWAEGDYTRFPKLVSELLGLGVEVIATAGTPAAQAVMRATTTTPLVMIAVGDPVGTGLADSLAHPGKNATGLTSIAPDLEGKRLELLAQVAPGLSRIAVMWNPDNAFHLGAEHQARAAAAALRIGVTSVRVRTAADFDAAFQSIVAERPGALSVLADRVFLHNRKRIVEFAARNRLPAVYAYRELVEAGGLMSFGPNYADMHRRAAAYVDRILKGARPGDLPIEQPTKFEFLVNLKTARILGVPIPPSLLLRADHVFE
jgi:putative ABC transport system substrate-binding protein